MLRKLLIAALMLAAGAAIADARADAVAAGAMDCLTTGEALAGVGVQAMRELNPLGAVAACALKIPAVAAANELPEPARTSTLQAQRAIWDGVAANNLAALIGMHAAPGIGLLVAAVIWERGSEEREFMRLCAIHEQLARHAMTCIYTPAPR